VACREPPQPCGFLLLLLLLAKVPDAVGFWLTWDMGSGLEFCAIGCRRMLASVVVRCRQSM